MKNGIASYGAHAPLKFWKKINLTVKILKITTDKPVLHFHVSCQKHAKTYVNRLKQSWN